MFSFIGSKIKGLAIVITIIGVVISVGAALLIITMGGAIPWIGPFAVAAGLAVGFVGCVFSWLATFLLYGFGELVDTNQTLMEQNEDLLYEVTKTRRIIMRIASKNDPAIASELIKELESENCEDDEVDED